MSGAGKEPVWNKPCSPLIFFFLLLLFHKKVRKLTKFITFIIFIPIQLIGNV
jgi:hypothetical protein